MATNTADAAAAGSSSSVTGPSSAESGSAYSVVDSSFVESSVASVVESSSVVGSSVVGASSSVIDASFSAVNASSAVLDSASADTGSSPSISTSVVSSPPSALYNESLVLVRSELPPEVASLISPYLSQVDIARCCLVCTYWNWAWLSTLWSKVSLNTALQCAHFGQVGSQRLFRTFLPNLLSFASIRGQSHGELLLVGPHEQRPRRLERIGLSFPPLQGPQSSQLSLVRDILTRCDRLTHLSLAGVRRLLPMKNGDPRSMWILFWIRSEILRSLFLDFQTTGGVNNGDSWTFLPNDDLPLLPALVHFSISGDVEGATVAAFLQRCPSLQILEIHRWHPWPQVPVLLCLAIRNGLHSLGDLVHDVPAGTDDVLGEFLEGVKWRSMSLSPSGIAGERTRRALLGAASTMEVLVVEGLRGFPSTFLQEFLVEAQNLKMFSGLNFSQPLDNQFDLQIQGEHISGPPVEIEVEEGETGTGDDDKDDAATQATRRSKDGGSGGGSEAPGVANDLPRSWSCENLESLAINVSQIPRSDVGGVFVHDCEDKAEETHRKVYRQLGRLSCLRELALGHGTDSGASSIQRTPSANGVLPVAGQYSSQSMCLSMSLPAGLGQLAGLRKLRVLDVSGTAHKIGVEELAWMREHWPLLKKIVGIEERVGVTLPHRWHGRDLDDVRVWMRRHPYGIGSAYPSLL